MVIYYKTAMKETEQEFYLSRDLFIKCKKGSIHDEYTFLKESGRGAYGRVFMATPKDSSKMVRAIKVISKAQIKYPITFINEIQILKKLDHPNIIKIYETYEDDKNYFVVTDFCEGGELFDLLSKQGSFSELEAREIFKQALYAINYCHTQHIAHRDLKPQNFLLMDKTTLSLKVIDFGLSFHWKTDMAAQLKERKQNKLIGTSYYIAPEVIRGEYDQRCDIWSLGVILYILVTAVPPFDGETDRDILEAVKKGEYTLDIPEMKNISSQLKDLIAKMMQPMDKRISIEQIYSHPWMNSALTKNTLRLNFGKIINFSKYSKLKMFAVTAIASQLSGKEIEKLGALFRQIDTNCDGFVSTKELKEALDKQKEKVPMEDLEKLLHFVDTDHNHQINYSEFVACCLENSVIFREENLLRVFRNMDSDKNGTVSASELREVLTKENQNLNLEIIDEIIKSCDKNGDGVIDFREFLAGVSQV